MVDKTLVIKEAQKYLSRGQIDKAIAEWEKLIKEYPDGNTYNTIGDLYLKKGDQKSAVDSFNKAANFFRHEGFSLKAVALYKKVLNIYPSDSSALYSLGELSEEKGLATDAIKYYLATADSIQKEGKKDQLLDIYEKILSISPSNIPLRNKVAEIFLKEGLKSDAVKEYMYIARLYDEKRDSQKAREYYLKILDIQPLNKEAMLGISYIYEKTGEMGRAVDHIKEADVLFPGDIDILFRGAELLIIKDDAGSAKDYLYRIIEKEQSNIKARRLLGEIYIKEGQKEKAWKEYLPVLDEMILEEKFEVALEFLENFKDVDKFETGKRLVSLYRQLGENDKVSLELVSLGDALLNERGLKDECLACYREALEIAPDNDTLKAKIDKIIGKPETEKEAASEQISVTGERTVDEIFTEADIFYRYGLLSEAKRLLEGLKFREPDNIDLHARLKSVYMDTSDKGPFVTECLILYDLYAKTGDIENAERMLKDADTVCPDDPRLLERAGKSMFEPTSAAPGEKFTGAAGERTIEDFEEEIAEADFYARQGLMVEAQKILERLHNLFPEDLSITERLNELCNMEISGVEETIETHEIFQQSAVERDEMPEGGITEEVPQPEKEEYEEIAFTEQDMLEAQEMPEPTLDNDVMEIFQEFKKGLEKELGDQDSETHYNLGIAYKEMGLLDDAIKEFQTAKEDPERTIQSASMLGVCYMEKGLYQLAIDVLNIAVKNIGSKDESYWAIKYDLATAYEKNNNFKEALEIFTEVYGWNAKYRNVTEKMSHVRALNLKVSAGDKTRERKDRVSYL
jgi:tetratricopeptide (TPR) repeat protein